MDALPTSPNVLRDVPYRRARVGWRGGAGPTREVTLGYDAYLPDPRPDRPVPALILGFGGAFHRGSKEDDAFPGAGDTGTNTAIAEYCRRFAAEGMACFSVGYRLAPSDPEPPAKRVLSDPAGVPLGRIAEVRCLMGLPPIAPETMAMVMEAAIDDFSFAALAIQERATEYGVDASRIVLGGWSAGARCALYAAYARQVPCAGVVALSGTMQPEDLERHLRTDNAPVPLLLVAAGRDLPSVLGTAEATVRAIREAGQHADLVSVPGQDHWYAAEATTDRGTSVADAIRTAMQRWTAQ